jgi:hypothetical protein
VTSTIERVPACSRSARRVVELGAGADAVLSAGGRGSVIAVFARAAYLRLPAGLFALTTDDVAPGPLHVRGAIPVHRLSAGDAVTVGRSTLQAGDVAVHLEGARIWRGRLPGAAGLAAGAGTAFDVLAGAPPSALADPALARRVAQAVEHLGRGDLARVVDALAGLGPGLTPAGDDALAGILLVARVRLGPAAEPMLLQHARRARTNDVAGAFLAWAARGQSIEPVHRFLTASAGQDARDAAAALADLLRYGHSSGADLAFGLGMGLRHAIATIG